jgi:hypothetical protein
MPQRPKELLARLVVTMADQENTLRELSPAFARLVTESPVDAANLLPQLSDSAMRTLLHDLDAHTVVLALEEETPDGGYRHPPGSIDAMVAVMEQARSADLLGMEAETEYVAACARRMVSEEDLPARSQWLPRVAGWLENVADDDVLEALSNAIDPLITVERLGSGEQPAEVGLMGLGVAGDIVVRAGRDMDSAEARLAECAVSESVGDAAAVATDHLSSAISETGSYAWSFFDTIIAAAETLSVASAAFGRSCLLLSAMVDESEPEKGLDEVQRQRIAAIVCRSGAARSAPRLAVSALRSASTARLTVERALELDSPEPELTALIWQERPTDRVSLLEQQLDTSTVAAVKHGINALATLVEPDGLAAGVGDYLGTLANAEPATVLKVVRGVVRSSVKTPTDIASRTLLAAAGRATRAVAVEILRRALEDGLAQAREDDWRELARGLDTTGLGIVQQSVMRRARGVLRYRRSRSQ